MGKKMGQLASQAAKDQKQRLLVLAIAGLATAALAGLGSRLFVLPRWILSMGLGWSGPSLPRFGVQNLNLGIGAISPLGVSANGSSFGTEELLRLWQNPTSPKTGLPSDDFAPSQRPEMVLGSLPKLVLTSLGIFEEHGVPFFLTGSTLLGAWQHHGVVPWDIAATGDVDIAVLPGFRAELARILVLPEVGQAGLCHVWIPIDEGSELGWFDGKDERAASLRFELKLVLCEASDSPQLDVVFLEGNASHFFVYARGYRAFRRQTVLPSSYVRYLDFLLPAPGQPHAFLSSLYGSDYAQVRVCERRLPDENLGGDLPVLKSTKEYLAQFYPLVWNRQLNASHYAAEVRKNGEVLYTLVLEKSTGAYAWSFPAGLPSSTRGVELTRVGSVPAHDVASVFDGSTEPIRQARSALTPDRQSSRRITSRPTQ